MQRASILNFIIVPKCLLPFQYYMIQDFQDLPLVELQGLTPIALVSGIGVDVTHTTAEQNPYEPCRSLLVPL